MLLDIGAKDLRTSKLTASSKNDDHRLFSTAMNLDFMLGSNYEPIATSHTFVCGDSHIVSYAKNVFSKCNILTKESQQIAEDMPENILPADIKVVIAKFFSAGMNSACMVVKNIKDAHYVSLFWTELSIVTTIKVTAEPQVSCINIDFHSQKGYLYFILTDKSSPKSVQYLRVLEIETPLSSKQKGTGTSFSNKQKILINCMIKKTGGVTDDLSDLSVSSDCKEIYLYGKDYFRQWAVSFNDKTIKESNYRNIERNVKQEKIVKVFWVKEKNLAKNTNSISDGNQLGECKDFLFLLLSKKILMVRRNELIKKVDLPVENPFFRIEQEPTEIALEKSLNQIYKTKFRMFAEKGEEGEEVKEKEKSEQKKIESKKNYLELCAISDPWNEYDGEDGKEIRFIGALSNDKIFVYKVMHDLEIKIECELNSRQEAQSNPYSFATSIKNISVSRKGKVALFNDETNNIYVLNQEENQEDNEITPYYGLGQAHGSKIISLSTPELSEILVSVSSHGSLKVWNYDRASKTILIDKKSKIKPVSAIIHPCGFILAVNFGLEIKIFGIVSSELLELVAIKTGDICLDLQYSNYSHTLISNEKSLIKFYQPFTLKCTGKIQPNDMRLEILKIKISEDGEYVAFQCSDFRVYYKYVNSVLCKTHAKPTLEQSFNENKDEKDNEDGGIVCHKQSCEYECFYFDFTNPKSNSLVEKDAKSGCKQEKINIFIGFSKTKYMAIYENYGRQLVAQFPILDCYVSHALVKDNLLFLATSKGSLRTYSWPIREKYCELQVNENNPRKAYLKCPNVLTEFQVWKDRSQISSFHLLSNHNQIVAGSHDGFIAFVNFKIFKNGKEVVQKQDTQQFNERKKMMKTMNNVKLMKVSEIDRISKLIQKTENDIEKIDYEIKNEKVRKNQQINQEQADYENNLLKRRSIYTEECEKAQGDIFEEINNLKHRLEMKKIEVERTLSERKNTYQNRINYQEKRINDIKSELHILKEKQRNRILELIQEHKENIRNTKRNNLQRIKGLQQEFEKFTEMTCCEEVQISEMSGFRMEDYMENQDIFIRSLKVEELRRDIEEKNKVLEQVSEKEVAMEEEDEKLQEQFEKSLQIYNNRRQTNLILHSELLKMQNQLLERQEILSKKDQMITMTYQEKQANLIFKDFVKGNLFKLETTKQKAIEVYLKKQKDLNEVFQELSHEIKKGEDRKLALSDIDSKIHLFESDKKRIENNIKDFMERIQDFKKFLLLQGVSKDSEEKRNYQEQEKLLTSIKWLEKRFNMACINEKKMISLKKSGISQVIQQNKNLLQQCNQLREEGLQFDREINHLREKLGEANKIIEMEKKLKSQDNVLVSQSHKLDLIRKMFKEQIESANKGIEEEEESGYPF